MIAYRLRDVGRRIGGAQILDGVTIDIAYGRVLALVGPNGAGKSTLLGLLAGDVAPDAGSVALDGEPLTAWGPARLSRARAVLLQSNQVAFSFAAGEVIEMGRAPWIGTERLDGDARAVAAAVAETDVAHLVARPYAALSGGEKARVSLARVLAQDTRVMLWDEPTAALDLRHQEDVLRIARRRAAAGRAVVVVLHDLSLAAAYADEIAVLHDGRLVAHAEPESALTAALIERVYGVAVHVVGHPDTGRPLVVPKRAL